MNQVLFLCTGNYYRSRYAEIMFNVLAQREGLPHRAFSRGLAPSPLNVGPMSPHTIAALTRLGIEHAEHLRDPLAVADADFESSELVVAVKEAEHRPLMERRFPAHLPRVEFWHVDDLDYAEPATALPHLDVLLTSLIARLKNKSDVA
ncbi:MAG: low molecular weight phosphatase family protein [Planctomycetia bacterium]|nr:low molecular weight phosphatase family protein [Planctomycetia bacterium]